MSSMIKTRNLGSQATACSISCRQLSFCPQCGSRLQGGQKPPQGEYRAMVCMQCEYVEYRIVLLEKKKNIHQKEALMDRIRKAKTMIITKSEKHQPVVTEEEREARDIPYINDPEVKE